MRRGLAALLLLLGCAGGSETGNPALPIELALGTYSSDPEAIGFSSGTAGTVIDEAWVSFGELAFLRGDECALLDGYDTPVPTLLVQDLAQPVELTVEVEDGTYCGVVVPLQRITPELPDGAPPELADHSVVLKGRREDGTPFVLMHPERDELELLPIDGELPVGGEDRLLLFFDVAFWMNGVDLESAEVGDDGVIHIDGTTNVDLWSRFENVNLECSMEMFADANDDAMIDDGDPRVATCPSN